MADTPDDLADQLLDHVNSPFHRGNLADASHACFEYNPACGDEVRLQVRIEGAHIAAAWFQGRGCIVSQAGASMLCERIDSRPIAEVSRLTEQEVVDGIGIPLNPIRRRCALLAFRAMQRILHELPPSMANEPASSMPSRNASDSPPETTELLVVKTPGNTATDSEPPVPLISCVMPTYGRPLYVSEAVEMFLRQDYPRKELIVLNDCPGQHFTCDHPEVRVVNRPTRFPTLGEKRNASIELAEGDLIAIWDDDDVYLPWRLSFSFGEMQRLGLPFYRSAEFWAYWGDPKLHDNQSVPGWVSHPNTLFTKRLWQEVGGYPHQGVGEDAKFFERVHQLLKVPFISQPLKPVDRFFLLRGTSHYQHMSMKGGAHPLDTFPGEFRIEPKPIADDVLRQVVEQLVETRSRHIIDRERAASVNASSADSANRSS